MKNEILYIRLDDYAGHEPIFLASHQRGMGENPKYTNPTAARPLPTSARAADSGPSPDYPFDTMPEDYAALILVGGYGRPDFKTADRVAPAVATAIAEGRIAGAICNAVSFPARHGALKGVMHTGSGLDQRKLWGGEKHTGETCYAGAQAVSDKPTGDGQRDGRAGIHRRAVAATGKRPARTDRNVLPFSQGEIHRTDAGAATAAYAGCLQQPDGCPAATTQ